ncbi:Transcriptional regulator, TetR family [Candidatus Sulfotelmatomonas gaucii]|uniref:Transcriptional regulator, TetR family n=1 Tax=Candidatus Sulfuritelmatomonas gaucii TaxID=2043161 RepID=A0A2N9LNR3_9BACT|nr:Transcriptional regulator, TetR family [Candidatus Sulfotelmatomonas gaucii]
MRAWRILILNMFNSMTKTTLTTKAEATRDRIVDVALDLFRRQGFEQTTMREIAAKAGVSLGSAYYYFESKEDLVMAFYERAMEAMAPRIEAALKSAVKFEKRLEAILSVKFSYFQPNRAFLGALFRHAADPENRLSPFSEATRQIRERDQMYFAQALAASRDVRVPEDLAGHMPMLLWLYQMGLILFWIYDRSPGQRRTRALREKSLPLLVSALKMARFSLLKPLRKKVVELIVVVEGG